MLARQRKQRVHVRHQVRHKAFIGSLEPLSLQQRHREFGEIVHAQVVEIAFPEQFLGRIERIAPEPRAGAKSNNGFHLRFLRHP